MNLPLFNLYPYMLKGLVGYINIGAFFVFIALLVRAHPKQSASFVFADFVNITGWESRGVVFFLGLLPGASAVNGFDGAAHLADEVPEPKRRIPQVMMGSALMSAFSGFPMVITYMFCIVNYDNLLAPVGGQPIAQLMVDSFDSTALTTIGILIYAVCMEAAGICILTAFSRVAWAVAQRGGLPFSPTIATVSKFYQIPANAVMICTALVIAFGAIILGSTTAINAVLGGGIVVIYLSYLIPLCCLLINRESHFPAKRYFNLGKWGYAFNIISVLWIPLITVWLCFPLYLPATGTTMNYAAAVLTGVLLFAAANWFGYSRSRWEAPVAMAAESEGNEMEA